ncbi:pentatricopeptide repeat-containing protein At1g19720 [Phoenix dactylifera]|uniref:Pentatricopeptide repeat-containing protein At1g19720 n=1 Tax=Phoenix dactylifera TaxID=42345 RepID=A0A8B7CE72_PHODC|nr:pentatricopeptide repeat-containing protein At1g19720 [Phoenix dactylifera]
MENPFLSCNTKYPVPTLLFKHQNPPQIPANSIRTTSSLPQNSTLKPLQSPPPPNPNTADRQLNRLRRHGKLQEAISALEQGPPIRQRTYTSLLQSCIDSDSIEEGRRLHASIALVRDPNPFVETKLVSMYAKCGSLEEARRVFDGMPERNLFTWSAMISGYSREQRWQEVVDLFFQMMHEGVSPDCFLLLKVLQACANTGDLETGRLLHSLAVRGGHLDSVEGTHLSNSVLAMYAKCGELSMARKIFENLGAKDRVTWNSIISGHCHWGENEVALQFFERMRAEGVKPSMVTWNILIANYMQSGSPELAMELMEQMESYGVVPDVFSWTSLISGFARNNRFSEALDIFQKMQLSGVEPNGMTIATAISACTSLKALSKGKELHSYAVKIGSAGSVLVANSLIDMYAKCGRLVDAENVFDQTAEKDVFTLNSMIGGYAQARYCGKAYDLFSKMESLGIRRNVVTWNAMISGYIQNGDEDRAMELFQRMEIDGVRKNTASWNTLIAGSLHNGHANKALRIFRQMQLNSVRPNIATILSILPACANLVSAWKVREIHACILHNNLQTEISIANSLIDAYTKSGDLGSAQVVFNGLSLRDLISWNSMIAGSVLHGYSLVAKDLFDQMKEEGVKPNRATFLSMINAYSLEGMVTEGKELFSSLVEEHQLAPGLEHYAAMVDLFGHSGRLEEASNLIEKMPIEPDSTVWNALLVAARIYGNVRLANLAAERLVKLEPRNPSIHRLLSKIQALCGKQSGMLKRRKPRKDSKLDSSLSCCWIEVRNKVYSFVTGEQAHVDLENKFAGLNGNSVDVAVAPPAFYDNRLEIEEEEEETDGIHSEKLAIAFAISNSPTVRSIRIIKSVRMCTNCHNACKFISKVYRREILIKDPKCLHHFKDGKCSCRDFW